MRAYLLIGGRSKRMGKSKAALRLGGRTFLEQVRMAAEEAFDEVFAVSKEPISGAEGLQLVLEPLESPFAAMVGLRRALEHAGSGKIWIAGVDYPLITAEMLRWLAGRFEASESDLLVPMWDGRPQMLCAGYSTALLGEIDEAMRRGDLALQRMLERREGATVSEEELRSRFRGEPLFNVNTPLDLQRLESGDGR